MYLNCHSYHSLRYGTLSEAELVKQAADLGIQTLVLTDINTISGIYTFKKECEKYSIKPIVGVEVRQENRLLYITIAKNFEALSEVNRLLTAHHCEGELLPEVHPNLSSNYVIYPLQNRPNQLLDHEFIGIREEELNYLVRSEYQNLISKMVILQPVTFKTQKEYNLHRILRAIDKNTLISKLTPNDYCGAEEKLKSPSEILQPFRSYPLIIQNTQKILEDCHFNFEFKQPRTKQCFTESKANDIQLLRELTFEGMKKRYPSSPKEAVERIEKELKVISECNFCAYFLITWDIVQFSNRMGFMHVGRGSGANSIVSYCLGITDICPLELDLYFERFLNLNRKTPPDFDLDWSWQNRDVILDYIFKKYGKDHVAFCGTNVQFKYRSIFREVGKAFGLPKEELDLLATKPMEEHDDNKVFQQVKRYGILLEKFPNQRSMHACGILISEEPITNYSILEMPPKGFSIIQFDMHLAEEIGLEKFDILSQRGLGSIKEAVDLIKEHRGIDVDIKDTSISKNEALCNRYLAEGNTLGCFYIESPAMRGLLRRLKCEDYITLVAASSIIRPGVAQSGMMREYIFRHNYPDKFEYFHDVFKEQLGETYGIMVYQEDVIKIALHFGGLSAAEGDILRRAMSGKTRSIQELQTVKTQFLASCEQLGHSKTLSQEVYRQIESFAGYSFCKAHSASYAVESYQSLYLKVYYPLEFMVAVINNQGGFYRTEVYIHEARRSGAEIQTPCVNNSDYKTTLKGSKIYLGLMLIQKLETKLAYLIGNERKLNGNYDSLEDFVRRIPIGLEGLQTLIFVGGFQFTGKQKNELLIEARMLMVKFKPETRGLMLIEEPMKDYQLPPLSRDKYEDAFDEYELLGFPVSCRPFDLLKTKYRGDVMAKALLNYHGKEVKMLAYLVARKHVPTKLGSMFFGTWIDANGDYFDTAHFADSLAKYPFKGGGCYLLLGKVEIDFHFPTITISKMEKLPFIADPRYSSPKNPSYKIHDIIREDVSMTNRKPYPQVSEINLPRIKMINS